MKKSLHSSAFLTNDGVGDGDLQPHPVSNLQARVRQLHHLDDGCHVCFTCRQRQVFKLWHGGGVNRNIDKRNFPIALML